jgi:hypothetical protein
MIEETGQPEGATIDEGIDDSQQAESLAVDAEAGLDEGDSYGTVLDTGSQAAAASEGAPGNAIPDLPKPDIGTLEVHALCVMYPEMTIDEKAILRADVIRCKVVHEDIILFEGKILDGRHRQWAIMEAWNAGVDVTYKTREFDPTAEGTTAEEFVARKNGIRRHMTPSQQSVIALKFYDRLRDQVVSQKTDKGKTRKRTSVTEAEGATIYERASALAGGCGDRYIRYAREVRDVDPALLTDVYNGSKSMLTAVGEAKKKAREANPPATSKNGSAFPTAPPDPFKEVEWETTAWIEMPNGWYYITIGENAGNLDVTVSYCAPEEGEPSIDTAHPVEAQFSIPENNLKVAKRKGYESVVKHASCGKA